tara:strand:+ start:105315 stop:105539 length:225 start_codon:yes stop_codon:yes gene_type:complete
MNGHTVRFAAWTEPGLQAIWYFLFFAFTKCGQNGPASGKGQYNAAMQRGFIPMRHRLAAIKIPGNDVIAGRKCA